jgi:hypothetical protein
MQHRVDALGRRVHKPRVCGQIRSEWRLESQRLV